MKEGLNRVGITGMGVVTPVGLNVEDFWRAIKNGESGIDHLPSEISHPDVKNCAQVKGFCPDNYFDRRELRRVHPSQQYAYAALVEASQQAGILTLDRTLQGVDPERFASVIGSGIAGGLYVARLQETITKKGVDKLSPFDLLQIIPCRINTVPTMKHEIYGPAFTVNAACASSGVSVIEGARMIMVGDADVVIVGGSDATVNQISISAFAAMRALSTRDGEPKQACRPFDIEADGFVLGEGAGVMILENMEHAERRGARVLAELIGYKQCSDSRRQEDPQDLHELGLPTGHQRNPDTEPSVAGAIATMKGALENAGITSEQIEYINAHGPGTLLGGKVELLAIKRVFGNYKVPVSSIKATTGHMIAGVGAEVVACIKAMQDGILPPTLNLRQPVRDDVDVIALTARSYSPNIVMKNQFGFGGNNVSLILRMLK